MTHIIYCDDHMLVAEKPAGLLSVPGRLAENKDCLVTRLQQAWPDALTVHRLDMATSGLMVYGRGMAAQRSLSLAFADRRVSKHYIAVVAGLVREPAGEVDLPLIADWPNRPRQMVSHGLGKPSLTRWRVRTRQSDRTIVDLEPVTGRSHQLRVHMMALGHPILGDVFYAPEAIVALSPRLLLHASALRVPHPVTGEEMTFHSRPEFV